MRHHHRLALSTGTRKFLLITGTFPLTIKQSEAALKGTSLSYMRIDGKIVPAIKLYVDKETYINFKREQWREEYHTKQLRKRNDFFSTMAMIYALDDDDSFEPKEAHPLNQADEYMMLLHGLIEYIRKHHPKYARYIDLVKLLSLEYSLSEASEILGKPYRTLYGWQATLRPIYEEYMKTVIRIQS